LLWNQYFLSSYYDKHHGMRAFVIFFCAIVHWGCSGNNHNIIETDAVITLEAAYFEAIKANDIALSAPKEGEWLYEHQEPGQTFEQYKNENPLRLSDTQYVIYLKPIGLFTKAQQKMLELTREYVSIFYQTKTILLNSTNDNIIGATYKRKRSADHEQLLAPYILDSLLTGKAPGNAIACMAITAKDLYPKESWNYVFGLASYVNRVGVSSIYRFKDSALDSIANYKQCLRRLIGVASHEVGHMFTMQHCIYAQCIMNGSNSLAESDAQPNRLCAVCQQKLYWNIRYDNRKRLKELSAFFNTHQLLEDMNYLKLDIERLK
jgi:archaemetzincin